MRGARLGGGASSAMGLAALLGACCLAGAPLYVSSAGSAAVQELLATTCASDSGLRLGVGSPPDADAATRAAAASDIAALTSGIDHAAPPVVEVETFVRMLRPGGVTAPLILLSRTGAAQAVDPPLAPLGPHDAAVSDGNLAILGARVGDRLVVQRTDGSQVDLVITQRFQDVPVLPEPSFWCGNRDVLRPNSRGDAPPVMAIVAPEVHASFPTASRSRGGAWVEVRLAPGAYTRHEVQQAVQGFEAASAAHEAEDDSVRAGRPSTQLPTLLARSDAVAEAVRATVAGVRVAGVAAALLVLVAASVMLAEERRRELRLLSLRGEAPWRSALAMMRVVAAPVALGGGLGWWAAFVAVRALGPASQVEAAVVRGSILVVVLGTVVAGAVAASVTAMVGDRAVDPAPRRRWARFVPAELALVGVATLSFRRLADGGGLRMSGVYARGGELLAQAFPLFAVGTVAAVARRPMRWLLRRWGGTGSRLPRGVRLGWRRVVLDPSATSTVIAATMVASGCFVLSTVLAASARQELDDKAATFLGADLAVTVLDPMEVPPWLDGRATVTVRIDAEAGGRAVDLLGVDPAEFHRVARWRDDAADRPLAELVSGLSPVSGVAGTGGRLPAVVVGAPSEWSDIDVATSVGGTVVPVHQTATARWFPGLRSERVLVVVDRASLLELVDASRRVIWVRDPATDTVDHLRREGARVATAVSRDEVFDGTSYRAQQWSFAPLGALGVLFAAVAVAVQLLVVEARRDARRAAHLVMRRTGFRGRDLWAAALVEVAVPFSTAAAMGAGVAVAAARVAVHRLDPLPLVAPPARVVVPHAPLLMLAAATLLAVGVLAASAVRSTQRGDPMEVLRGTA